MTASYSATSPWNTTELNENFLDILSIRPVASEEDDFLYTLEPQYTHRPDLLAHDLYGNSKLWWVFIQRNMDVLQDPVYDFVPGIKIYIPKKSKLFAVLGI